MVPCALHHCIYSLTIVTLIASDPICSWMKPEMYTVLSTAPGSLNPCPSFLLLSLLCRRWVCVFSFFYCSSKDLISPKFWCQAIVLWSLFSVRFHLVLNSQALGTSSLSSKKRKKSSHAKYIRERQNVSWIFQTENAEGFIFSSTHPPAVCSRFLLPRGS